MLCARKRAAGEDKGVVILQNKMNQRVPGAVLVRSSEFRAPPAKQEQRMILKDGQGGRV